MTAWIYSACTLNHTLRHFSISEVNSASLEHNFNLWWCTNPTIWDDAHKLNFCHIDLSWKLATNVKQNCFLEKSFFYSRVEEALKLFSPAPGCSWIFINTSASSNIQIAFQFPTRLCEPIRVHSEEPLMVKMFFKHLIMSSRRPFTCLLSKIPNLSFHSNNNSHSEKNLKLHGTFFQQ